MQATCEKLTFRIGAGKPVTLSAQGKQVIVRSEQLAASADCVRRSGPEGASLTLEGHVRVRQEKNGRHAEFFSDQAGINLATDWLNCDWSAIGGGQEVNSNKPMTVAAEIPF
jgi:hypothetical protein